MRIGEIRTLSGPNVYTYRPALVMRLYLEDLAGKESYEVPGFIDRLLDHLPGLHEHHCAQGAPGGFIKRLHEGTYFGHIVEHVALELTQRAGIPANHGKTRSAGEPGCYHVVIEYTAEHGARHLLRTAVGLVEALVKGEPFPLEDEIGEAKRVIARTELGPSTRAIVEAAERRGIPWSRLNGESLVQLGYGKHRKFVQAAMCSQTSAVAVEIACDKELTKSLLRRASVPVPQGEVVRTAEEAVRVLAELNTPVVVKPFDGRQGQGVSLNLTTAGQVAEAFHIARRFSEGVLVEELFVGRDYRVLVVNGKVVAAGERVPAQVTGDGSRTITELIEVENENPLRSEGHDRPLTQLRVDAVVTAHLRKCGLSLDYVPHAGEMILLRESANLSTGGTARDVTGAVHPEVRSVCERAARVIGLDICGIDLVVPDIAAPIKPGAGGIIEVNAAPGLRMHHHPSEGEKRDAGAAIVEMLYPPGAPARVPIISVTGTNGKTTITRMIAHLIGAAGKTVGMATTDGIYLGGERVARGDATGPRSARAVLSDPAVEVAVLETARGGIVRSGLGYDWSDVSVISNIQPDHIGQDGIEGLDDLLYIKSLVAERVREGGTLVLNADDGRLAGLMRIPRLRRVSKKVVYYSLDPAHSLIRRHLAAGGCAYGVRDDWVVEMAGAAEYRIIRAPAIPATFSGAAEFQVSNALAAVAACRACGTARELISTSLSGFRPEEHNAGRANLYRVGGGYVLIDYGHNPDAFAAVFRLAAWWQARRVTGVIGVPGDRDDSVVEQAGRTAAKGCDRLIFKEDDDLRGRRGGEVAALLCRAAKNEVPDLECRVVLDERRALASALEEIAEGEVVIFFYDKLEPTLEILGRYGAAPAPGVEGLLPQVSLAAR